MTDERAPSVTKDERAALAKAHSNWLGAPGNESPGELEAIWIAAREYERRAALATAPAEPPKDSICPGCGTTTKRHFEDCTLPAPTDDPIRYHVEIEHWQDGTMITHVHDVGSSETDRASVAAALRQAADRCEAEGPTCRN